ncbi:amidohydrolase [Clostridium swellfunianum]|uniref:amidohydrolase n=1 Tax=Clostridium swellfunianum TaxID=1367462 RepID=UPI00202F1585|nr:amidohydrolase [Clostridium swellfunianum]MCM0650525.1 amidohydrolase [Clostridium swellfunianum]
MLLIKNGTILTMAGESIEYGQVLVNEGKIIAVGRDISIPDNCEIIDVNGGFVMPGIIDAHCHIGMCEDGVGFEGDDINEGTDPATPHLRAIDAINPMDRAFIEAYENGVTCVCTGPGSSNVIAGQFATIKTKGKRIDNMIIQKTAAMKVAFGENPKKRYSAKNQSPSTRMATAAILREYLLKTKAYMENKGKSSSFDMKLESLVPVVKGELNVKAHVHRADDIFTAIRIAKEFGLKMTLEHCTEGHLIADELVKEGFYAIVGPSIGPRGKVELKELNFETPAALHKAGIKIALMTDHPVVPVHYLPMCAALAVRSGLDEETALKAITINPAEILGISDKVGSLQVDKDADIVVFDKHPFDIQAKTTLVLIDGEIVFERS